MIFDQDFCYSFSFFFPLFLREKKNGENNNQSRGKKNHAFLLDQKESYDNYSGLKRQETHHFQLKVKNVKFFPISES